MCLIVGAQSCVLINLDYLTVDYKVTEKSFNFPKKFGLPFYFVSAADGTNVVKVGAPSFLEQILYSLFLVACIILLHIVCSPFLSFRHTNYHRV